MQSWLAGRRSRAWFGSRAPARRLAEMQFAVVDVDLTGTSVLRDRVTGIAALPVRAGVFRIADLRYCEVPAPSAKDARGAGEWRSEYLALREFIAGHTIVTYNPAFVRHMVSRACRSHDLPLLGGEWMDLEAAAVVMGKQDNELTTMNYWLDKMKTAGRSPHDATYDVFAMAQLLQAVLAYSEDAGIDTFESFGRIHALRAWFRWR